jgi:hypothetical protein
MQSLFATAWYRVGGSSLMKRITGGGAGEGEGSAARGTCSSRNCCFWRSNLNLSWSRSMMAL